ncbi:EF hand family protein [Trypanosoma rangeli]|uniref:EF hand family protein n=1 Tax=Trypanosoma rangeli TaxID=5698 RepID=A0A422NKK1_TRYRA|nr:EF hand family protein [Trypanosoma rangeli]RNF06030.1 EF hand family protein [Trypanosoma rangeli]|eukprot:RNF06030.1 EF hand family protein [Trypanosoma rangeli]
MNDPSVSMAYSPGVLIGNWYEEMRAREDKVSFYKSVAKIGGTHGGASLALTEATDLGDLKDVVVIGQPLQLVNVATGAALALDTALRFAPKPPHQFLVTAADAPQPQVRSTWVLHRAKDENNIAYTKELHEEHVLHYGQRVRIANEDASPDGFCYLRSGVRDIGHAGQQLLTAALGACKDDVFVVVKPGERRDDICDGAPVQLGDAVAFFHAATNQPIRCTRVQQSTSFGYEFEVSCSFPDVTHSRSLAAVTSHPENLFFIGGATQAAQKSVSSSATAALRSRSDRSKGVSLMMSSGIGLDLVIARIREGALRFGGRLGLRTFSKALRTACNEHRRTLLSREQLLRGVHLMGVVMQPMELDAVFKRLDRVGDGLVVAQDFLREVRGDAPPHRLDAVIEAFQRLTIEGGGSVDYKDMLSLYRFNASQLPDVEEGVISVAEAVFDFVNSWPGKNDMATVTLEEFVAYYTDVSPAVDDDARFLATLQRCWTIPETNAYKSGQPRRHVTVFHTDDTTDIIAIPDSLVIDIRDAAIVREVLLQHGVRDIKDIQATM